MFVRSLLPSSPPSLPPLQAVGDHSKTLDCLFLNVPSIPYVDPTLDRNHAAHEWLSSSDVYRSHKTSAAANNSAEHHALQKFHIPPAAAAIHLLCRVETRPKDGLTYSTRELSDARYGAEANGGLLGRFAEGLSPKARAGIRGDAIAADVVPYCLWLLSAGGGGGGRGSSSLDRAVSSLEVLTEGEREAFQSHVNALRSLGLTYVKADDADEAVVRDDGGYGAAVTMRLEPEIDRVVMFEGLDLSEAHRRRVVPSALKELLAHGVNLENMRERERKAKKKSSVVQADASGSANGDAAPSSKEQAPNSRITGDPASTVAAAMPVTPEEISLGRHKALEEASKGPKRPAAGSVSASAPAAGKNFLGVRAAKAKAARTARRAATVGFDRSKKRARLSHSGSGAPLDSVIRYKYQKGFTQAVRVPCRVQDLV